MTHFLSTIVLASIFAIVSPAMPASLVWDPPTTYEDGTPLAPEAITGYRVYCGTSSDTATLKAEIGPDAPTYLLDPAHGGHWFSVSALGNGLESKQSDPIRWMTPGAPTNLRIQLVP